MSIYKDFYEEYHGKVKRLQAENEQLKKEIWQLQHRQMWDKEATLQAELLIKENERLKETNLQLQTIDMEIDRNNKYRKALEEIQKMFSEPCIEGENCFTCNSNCSNKDVLNITSEVLR